MPIAQGDPKATDPRAEGVGWVGLWRPVVERWLGVPVTFTALAIESQREDSMDAFERTFLPAVR